MSKITVFLTIATAIALAFCDAYAIQTYASAGWPGNVSWLKVAGALILQAFAIVLAVVSFALIAQRWQEPKPWEPGSAPWYLPLPLAVAIPLAALSVALFFNGVVCGNESLPTTRGVGICGR